MRLLTPRSGLELYLRSPHPNNNLHLESESRSIPLCASGKPAPPQVTHACRNPLVQLRAPHTATPRRASFRCPFRSIAPGLRFAPEIEDANTTTGVISGNVFGNDQILCGNVASAQWVFTPQIYCPQVVS